MTNRTHSQLAFTGWQHFDQPTADPTDSLRALIHPTGQAVTIMYWGSGHALVFDVAHLGALVPPLGQDREAVAQPAVADDDILRATATRSHWPGLSVIVTPTAALLALLFRVKRAEK